MNGRIVVSNRILRLALLSKCRLIGNLKVAQEWIPECVPVPQQNQVVNSLQGRKQQNVSNKKMKLGDDDRFIAGSLESPNWTHSLLCTITNFESYMTKLFHFPELQLLLMHNKKYS